MSHFPLDTSPGRIGEAEPGKRQLCRGLAGGRSCLPWKMAWTVHPQAGRPLSVSQDHRGCQQQQLKAAVTAVLGWNRSGPGRLGTAGTTTRTESHQRAADNWQQLHPAQPSFVLNTQVGKERLPLSFLHRSASFKIYSLTRADITKNNGKVTNCIIYGPRGIAEFLYCSHWGIISALASSR